MIRAVLFDCDGVLVDSEPLSAEAWLSVAPGRERITRADLEACIGTTEAATYAYLAERAELPPYEEALVAVDHYRTSRVDELRTFTDAVETVRTLALGGIPLGLVSSSHRSWLDAKLDRFDLARYFGAIVAGNEVEHGKPAPDGYLDAAAFLGIDPGSCLVIEDSRIGGLAGVAAGMRVVIVRRDGALLEDFTTVSSLDADMVRSWLGLF